MSLSAHFSVRRPEHTTTIDLDAAPGEVLGLIGPNGAGKSTALRALAGLVRPTEGEIALSGRLVATPDVHVPASQRRVGFVFQDHLLFPHLDALDNVAFGPRTAGRGRRDARAHARSWLERLGVADLAGRRPAQLSGGQAQRVAIARALATDPQLLLLDEPTASLDAAGAMSLRTQLRAHLDDFEGVAVIVTHVALDAMVMADRLVVIDEGQIVQQGAPADVAAYPRTQHVAALVGLNLTRGVAVDGTLSLDGGGVITSAERVQGPAFAAFSPGAVSLYASAPTGSPRNVWEGRVTSLAPHGDAVRVQVEVPWPLLADITPAALAGMGLVDGSRVWASVKATEVTVYPA